MSRKYIVFLVLLFTGLLTNGCGLISRQDLNELVPTTTEPVRIANPASENCINLGGGLMIQERGDGQQYGVCYFEDNRQCEEWALLRGDCPEGGLKITGYTTPAAQYCVITGGPYTITGDSNSEIEQGTCTFTNGIVCDVWDTYNGKCSNSD